ncbi:hypothetical protein [Salinibaculum salinum]|uniref:hypothetical protein n=1 Tax=Salinibaculum salinum TaxID=3131996 RepID=UPI0030EF528A
MQVVPDQTYTLTDGLQLTISRTPKDPDRTTATEDYRYELSCLDSTGQATTLNLVWTGTAERLDSPLHRGGQEATRLQIRVPEGSGLARVRIRVADRSVAVMLPDPTVTRTIESILQGDRTDSQEVLGTVRSVPELAFACGQFLSVEQTVTVLQAVANADRYAASRLHSTRYAIIRGALTIPVGFTLQTASQLEALVDGLDNIGEIGAVELVPALADVMAAVHQTVDETETMLESLGYDRTDLEQREDGLWFACYLAHLVCTKGVYAAEGYAMERRYHLTGQYARRKRDAKQAAFDDRGRVWRRLLCAAARQHTSDEFAYVLANALYWTGRTTMTDSWMETVLFEGAERAAEDVGVEALAERARYNHASTVGHAHRSNNNYRLALTQFERAKAIASATDSLHEWLPIYNAAIVDADAALEASNHERAVELLGDAIDHVLTYDIPTDRCNEIVHHLAGQQQEARAMTSRSQDDVDRAAALSEAQAHYEASGLSRSRERVTRKLANATSDHSPERDDPPDAEQSSDTSTQPSTGQSSDASAASDLPASGTESETTSGSTPSTTESHAEPIRDHTPMAPNATDEDAFVEPPELQDRLTQPDESAVGGSDLMTSPDDRDAPENHRHPDDFDHDSDTTH